MPSQVRTLHSAWQKANSVKAAHQAVAEGPRNASSTTSLVDALRRQPLDKSSRSNCSAWWRVQSTFPTRRSCSRETVPHMWTRRGPLPSRTTRIHRSTVVRFVGTTSVTCCRKKSEDRTRYCPGSRPVNMSASKSDMMTFIFYRWRRRTEELSGLLQDDAPFGCPSRSVFSRGRADKQSVIKNDRQMPLSKNEMHTRKKNTCTSCGTRRAPRVDGRAEDQ